MKRGLVLALLIGFSFLSCTDWGAWDFFRENGVSGEDVPPPDVLDSLFARYTFDSSISPETDQSGNLRDGTLFGASWINDGVRGGVLQFDGSSNYMEIPVISGGTPEFTFSAWINIASLPASLDAIYATDQWSPQGFHFNLQSSGALEAGVEGNTPFPAVQSARSFGAGDLGQWWHIAAVYDSGAMTTRIHVDGAFDNSRTHTAVFDARLLVARIGDYGSGRWFDGRMDDVRLYSRALSDAEINQVYNATK